MAVRQQEQKTDSNVVSSHGYVVDNSEEYIAPKADPAADAVDSAAAAAAGKTEAEAGAGTDAGTDADPAAAADPAKDEAAKGEAAATGPDLNAVLQEIMGIKQAMLNPQQQQQADPMAEIDAALQALEQKAKDGEISNEELVMQTVPLIEQRVQMNMERKLQDQAQAKSVSDAQGAFIAQNPDFVGFAQSPEAAAIINGNPILDNVSAFYMAKHKQAEARAQTLELELTQLKQQQSLAIKNAGKKQAEVVGSDQGIDAGAEKLYRGDGLSPQQGGIAALRRAKAGM